MEEVFNILDLRVLATNADPEKKTVGGFTDSRISIQSANVNTRTNPILFLFIISFEVRYPDTK
jgi:hypothetical protein